MIGFGLVSHWLKKWHEFVNQSESTVKQNQSKREITFDTQLKTVLLQQFGVLSSRVSIPFSCGYLDNITALFFVLIVGISVSSKTDGVFVLHTPIEEKGDKVC